MASLTLYGSAVADSTLTTACQMAASSGGVETSKATAYTGATGNFGEVWSKGNASLTVVSSIPATPTGNGWVYYPGAGTFAAGNWAPVITMAVTVNNAGNQTLRIFKRSGGVYTSIGIITFIATTIAKTTYTLTPTSMPATTFATGDGLYFDLWYQDNTGAASDTVTVYESTTATSGVTNDFQVTTSAFTPVSTLARLLYVPFGIPRAFSGTIMPTVIAPPLIYTPRAFGATLLAESRTFVPRAFGGVYIPDDPTELWVPRALGGTTQISGATNTTSAFTEALTADDSASTFVQVALPVDALTASDTLLATDGDVPLDSLTASDIGGLFGWPVDALTASDSLLVVATDIPLDGLSASASLLGADGSLYTEANLASDIALTRDGGLFTEASVASDALSGGTASGLVESLSTAESTLDLDAYAALDGLSADDSASTMSQSSPSLVTTTYSFTEALVASDSLLKVDTALATEATSASDSQSGGTSSSFSEGLAVGDALAALEGYVPFDALAASDIGGMTRGFVEALFISESAAVTDSYRPAEVQSVAESLLAGKSTVWVDLLAASDSLTVAFVSPAQPGLALLSDALRGQAALSDLLVAQAAMSDALRGQATTGDALRGQVTTGDVATGSALLSDQG